MKKLAILLGVIAMMFATQVSVFADWKVPVSMVIHDPAVVPFENVCMR